MVALTMVCVAAGMGIRRADPAVGPESVDDAGEAADEARTDFGATGKDEDLSDDEPVEAEDALSDFGAAVDELVARMADGEGCVRTTTYERALEVPMAAEELVLRYQAEGDCLMCHAGYMDLAGNTWACLLEGPGWVDLCTVCQGAQAGESVVRTTRMEVSAWEETYGRLGA